MMWVSSSARYFTLLFSAWRLSLLTTCPSLQPTLAAVPEGAVASADDDGERARQRDWALLRALKAGVPPAATWQTLASSHLIDGMEWSVQDMMSRHAYVKECMSVVANLLGPELSGHKLAALHDVCS